MPVAAAVVVTGVLVAPGSVGADENRPAFVNGDAKAAANLFDVKVQITGAVGGDSGLAIGFGAGRALTSYQDTSANAEGRAIDLSLMSLLNRQPTAECPDIIPLWLTSTEPPVTLAENTDPARAASQLTTVLSPGFPTFGPEFGTQDATAGPDIASHATTTAKMVDGGLVKLTNPRTESSTRLVNGVREAVAVSTADSLSIMGGAMTLSKPTWTATSKSGGTTVNEATFTYASAVVLGINRPGGNTADLQTFKGFIESAFGFLGLKLVLPKATVVPGPNGTGQVSISPLTMVIADMPLGKDLLRPILRALMPQIDQAITSAMAVPCADPGLRLVADIALGIAGGTGGVSIAVGGADAMTDDIYYPPVNLDGGSTGSLDPAPSLAALPTGSGLGSSVLGTDLSSGSGTIAPLSSDTLTTDTLPLDTPTTTEADIGDEETAADGEVATVRRAAQSSTPGETGGTAGWVTIAALGVIGALALGDQLVMRRSRRKFVS